VEMLIGGLAVALALLAKAVAWLSGKYRLAWWRAFAFGATVIWVWMLLWDFFSSLRIRKWRQYSYCWCSVPAPVQRSSPIGQMMSRNFRLAGSAGLRLVP